MNVPSQLLRNNWLTFEVGHVQVHAAVVVEVTGRGAHGVAVNRDAAGIGHVGETQRVARRP